MWDILIAQHTSPAAYQALVGGRPFNVGLLLRDNADRETALPAIVLMVERDGHTLLLPNDDFILQPGDAILLAGQKSVRSVLNLTLQNANALHYVLTGEDRRGGTLWQYLFARKEGRSSRTA